MENHLCCTSLRDLTKDTLLRDRLRLKPSTRRESNPRPLEFLLSRRALYHCATTTAHTLESLLKTLAVIMSPFSAYGHVCVRYLTVMNISVHE